MSNTFVPFDNNPVTSPLLKTSSYTVPAGKYARVQVLQSNFSIDGVQVYPAIDLTIGSTTGSGIRYYTDMTEGVYIVTCSGSKIASGTGVASSYIGYVLPNGTEIVLGSRSSSGVGSSVMLANTGIQGFIIPYIRYAGSGAGGGAHANVAISGTGYTFGGQGRDLWIKTGALLNGAGYIVTEYNIIV